MSASGKAILSLREMPKQPIETACNFMQSMQPQLNTAKPPDVSAFGIACIYANPALTKREGAQDTIKPKKSILPYPPGYSSL